MTATLLHIVDDEPANRPAPALEPAAPELRAAGPSVFVRTLSIPQGAPWDQARAARLEAELGAPLPLSDVACQLRRLDPWALGRPARYAACYMRRQEAGDDFRKVVAVGGRVIAVRFLSREAAGRAALRLAATTAGAGVGLLLVLSAITSAIVERATTTDKLAVAEHAAAVGLRSASLQAGLSRQARLLDAAGVRNQSLNDVLDDMAWVSVAKAPDARIDAFHWEAGYPAVVARGDAAPFVGTGRTAVRAAKPLSPGLWLWGIEPSHAAQSSGGAIPGGAHGDGR